MHQPTRAALAPPLAAYGNAVFTCSLLESGLKLLIAVASDARKRQGLPDPASDGGTKSVRMLGDLFPLAMQYEAISSEDRAAIWAAIRLRNLLVHNYWTESTVQAFLTPAGRSWLEADLEDKREQIRDADRLVTTYVNAYLAMHGLSVNSLSAPMFAEYEPNPGPPDSVLH